MSKAHSTCFLSSVGVEDEGDTLQDPMTDMAVSLDISNEHFSGALGILSVLGDIDGSLDGTSQLELVGFDRDDANERHFHDQLLGVLVVEAVLLDAPASTFQEHSLDVGTRVEALGDLGWVALLGDLRANKRSVCWLFVWLRSGKEPQVGSFAGFPLRACLSWMR